MPREKVLVVDLDALLEYKKRQPQAIVIMITGNVMLEDTIAALRGGAYDFDQIIGESPAMAEMIRLARKVAASEASSVLLLGESGTGKDLVAKAVHYGSSRADQPFIAINCAAIPATLIESELFGHEKGAFTDARARKEGLFEQAQGGTLFLDEIGELELGLQAKLLRVLEEGSFRRVGGLKDLPLDVRVVAASNRDLKVESLEDSDLITPDWLPRGLVGDERPVSPPPVAAASQPAELGAPSFQLPATSSFQLPDHPLQRSVHLLRLADRHARIGGAMNDRGRPSSLD